LRDMGDHKQASERKRLNEELENVRNELSELKARLSKVEAGKSKAISGHKSPKATPTKRASKTKRKGHG